MSAERRFEIPAGARKAECRSCQAEIFWIVTTAGKRMPTNPDGTSHFSTCPNAALHRGGAGASQSILCPPLDPPIEAGPLKAFRRTDGKIAITDERRRIADRTIRLVTSEHAARVAVRELAARETP